MPAQGSKELEVTPTEYAREVPLPVARIQPVLAPTEDQAEAIAKAPRRPDGTVRNVFLTLAHHPKLLSRFNAFAGTFFRYGLLPAADRELVILRVATRTRCAYELAQHLDIARADGLDDPTIRAALDQSDAGRLTERQQTLLAVTDEILASGRVEDQLWDEVAQLCDQGQLIELVSIVGFYRYAADLMNVIGIEIEGPIDLAVDWMPSALISQG